MTVSALVLAIILLALFLSACALAGRSDDASEEWLEQLAQEALAEAEQPSVLDGPNGTELVEMWPAEPEHSHRSALAGRRPHRLGVFAQVGRPGHPPLNSNDR
jgi:hypothetical protein